MPVEHDVGDGEERQRHDQGQAGQPVDVDAQAEQVARDDAAATEERDGGHRERERRADDGQQGDDVDEHLDQARRRHADLDVGEEEGHGGAHGGHERAEDHGVDEDLVLRGREIAHEDRDGLFGQGRAHDRADRPDDGDEDEGGRDDGGHDDRGVDGAPTRTWGAGGVAALRGATLDVIARRGRGAPGLVHPCGCHPRLASPQLDAGLAMVPDRATRRALLRPRPRSAGSACVRASPAAWKS